jgi:hypothetical protein
MENKIFEELKDKFFEGIKYIKKTYKDENIDYKAVYRRIINYRIKKYGTSYIDNPANDIIKPSKERLREQSNIYHKKWIRRRR